MAAGIAGEQCGRLAGASVEFYQLLGWTQAINHLRLSRGRTLDIRNGDALDGLDSAFDEIAHTVDVRRINSRHSQGHYNIPSVGLFVWRLKAYPVTESPAYCLEEEGPHCYTFSALGNDTPLYNRPQQEAEPTDVAGEMNLPVPIRRRAFETRMTDYYGEGKSLYIWQGMRGGGREPIPSERIIAADLSDWRYLPRRGFIAVDPKLGRITFPPRHSPKYGVWVSYLYGFSADIGGGEYNRPLSQPNVHSLYRVGRGKNSGGLARRWRPGEKHSRSMR